MSSPPLNEENERLEDEALLAKEEAERAVEIEELERKTRRIRELPDL